MNLGKRNLLLALLIFFPLMLSGCWDYEEYEDLIQVTGIGIDYDKESRQTRLTIEYTPIAAQQTSQTQGTGAQNVKVVHSAADETLLDAFPKLQQVIFKKMFFGYLKVIVISEEAAKYNMANIITWLNYTPVLRDTVFLVITSSTAEKTLSTLDGSKVAPGSEEIYNLINLTHDTGVAYPVSVLRLRQMLAIPGIEATVPRVITVSKKPQLEVKGGIEGNIKRDLELVGDHRIAGLAAFKGEKFAGWLNEQESLGFAWITGRPITTYKTSEPSIDTENVLYFRIFASDSTIKVEIENDEPVFEVNVKVTADFRKYYSKLDSDSFFYPEDISHMEEELSENIHSDIEAALKKGQEELRSDIFGFGFALFRKNPNLWKTGFEEEWDQIFPDVPIKINVEAKVKNTGKNITKFKLK